MASSSRFVVAEHVDEADVYSGLERLGHYVKQGSAWLALNDDDQVLGRFPHRQAAIAAIVASAGRV